MIIEFSNPQPECYPDVAQGIRVRCEGWPETVQGISIPKPKTLNENKQELFLKAH